MSTAPPRRRRSKAPVIVAIWVLVFAAAVVVAAVFQDDDPNTDDASGAGALAFIAGAVLTVAYLGLDEWLESRAAGKLPQPPPGAAPPPVPPVPLRAAPRIPMSRRRKVLLTPLVLGGIGLWVVMGVGLDRLEQTADSTSPAPAPAATAQASDPVEAVRAAARAADDRAIRSVDCTPSVSAGEASLVMCAVTYAGPACQLWMAEPSATPMGEPADGMRGRVVHTATKQFAGCR